MTNYIDVRDNRSSKAFGNRCAMLGVSGEEQCNILNNTYKDKMKFRYVDGKVTLYWVNESIRILEIPNIRDFDIDIDLRLEDVTTFKRVKYMLSTIKFPSGMARLRSIELGCFSELSSVWLWDDTEHDLLNTRNIPKLSMIIVQHSDGRKPTVIRKK